MNVHIHTHSSFRYKICSGQPGIQSEFQNIEFVT